MTERAYFAKLATQAKSDSTLRHSTCPQCLETDPRQG
jgi:hypothetical protein